MGVETSAPSEWRIPSGVRLSAGESAWDGLADLSAVARRAKEEGVIRRCVSNKMADYAALIRPTGSDPCSALPHALQHSVRTIWTRAGRIVQNRWQNSGGDDGDYRFPGPCL